MRLHLALSLLCSAVVLLAAGCRRESPVAAASGEELTIGYSRLRISLPIFIAEERGIFRKHGVRVRLRMYDTAQPMMQALVEGNLDVAGYTALPITYGAMARSGSQLLFLTALVEDQQHRLSYLLRRKTPAGAQPAIRSIADLRGKTIGILPTIAYRAWMEAILKENGVNPGEVTLIQIEPLLQAQTLAAGGVDALFTNDPAATAALANSVAELITDFVEVPRFLGEPFLFGSFNVRKAWADAHPDQLRRLIAALDEAVALVNREPATARLAMRPYLSDVFKSHVERYPDARYLSTAEISEEAFAAASRQYATMGIIPRPVSLAGLVPGSGRGPQPR